MTRFGVMLLLAGTVLAGSLAGGPARALDVVEGLQPADFRTADLAPVEVGLLEGGARLDPRDWIPTAKPEAGSRGRTTLFELGVSNVGAERTKSGDPIASVLSQPSAVDLRVLATPGLRDALAEALGDDLGSLGDVLGNVEEENLGSALDEVLHGGLLEDVPLDALPVGELLDVIEELDLRLLDLLREGVLRGLERP